MLETLHQVVDRILSVKPIFLYEWGGFVNIPFLAVGSLINSIIPKVDPKEFCEVWKLCSIRERNGEYMVAVKYIDGRQTEIPLKDIVDADEYFWMPIIRTYASGHVFISDDKENVYLLSTEKDNSVQHQFTGGAPIEEQFSNIIYKSIEGKTKINIYKVEDNAVQRTLIRTWAKVTDVYNDMPLVDRVLMERQDDQWNKYRRLVLLMHFIVKSYEWNLWFCKGEENIIGGRRYRIDDLLITPNVAPNAYIISNKARQLIK